MAGGPVKSKLPPPQAPGGGARSPRVIDPASIPTWQQISSQTLEAAARDGLALVIYFPGEGDTDASFADKELANISKGEAVFIKVQFTEDREKSPWTSDTVVPASKILSDNPSRDYKIAVGKMTVVIADSYGNEYTRLSKQPKATELKGYLTKVKENAEKTSEKLQKNLDKANESLANKDRKGALKLLLKNFGEGVVGLTPQEDSIRAYHDILDTARTEIAELTEKKDAAGLKALAKDFAKTDVEKEINEAIKSLK